MKRCPSCNRTYTDLSLNFCLEDGTPLVSGSLPGDLNATVRDAPPPQTSDPPPTEIYRQERPLLNQVAERSTPRSAVPQWSSKPPQMFPPRPKKKSTAIWWILGGLAVVTVIGIGLIIMILALASISSSENTNTANSNSVNRGPDANANRTSNVNSNTSVALASSLNEDFSTQKWRTGNFQFGDIWYADDEYHMRSKEKTYLVMYAPSSEYNTENATVRVTARSADGTAPVSGFGLIVHGEKSKENELEDYALLIYTGNEPQFEVVMHKGGTQKTLVPWTKSAVIRSGTNPNQLEIRSKGGELSFYVNGRYLTRITDDEKFKRGLAGLYTSETAEIVFDDLEIQR
jgi:hypothetical protein